MASSPTGGILRQVRRLFGGGGSVAGLSEGILLERFVSRRDEAAFEAIVARHGPMVLGVCRRLLHDPRDADDAFQATFLVLVKKAGAIRDREALGPWLYGVARKVALRSRATSARRLSQERPGPEVEAKEADVEALSEADRHEFRAVLDEELGRLPEKYRSPVVLCYLEGLTHDQAAERLAWPVGTVRSRLAHARDQLRGRLARRGLALPIALVVSSLAAEAKAAPVPPALFESTIHAAMGLAAGGTAAGVASATVASLMGGVLKTMYLHKLKALGVGLLSLGVATGGAAVVAQQGGIGVGGPPGQGEAKASSKDDRTAEVRRLKEIEAQLEQVVAEERELDAKAQVIRAKKQRLLNTYNQLKQGEPAAGAPPAGPGLSATSSDSDKTIQELRLQIEVLTHQLDTAARRGAATGFGGAQGFGASTGGAMTKAARPGATETTTTEARTSTSAPATKAARSRAVGMNQMLAVVTPKGDRVALYNTETGTSKLYRAPADVRVTPIVGGTLVVLSAEGKAISQVAAYSLSKEAWVTADLKHPVSGSIQPVVGMQLAAFRAGRYLGAFGVKDGTWDVIDVGDAPANPKAGVGGESGTSGGLVVGGFGGGPGMGGGMGGMGGGPGFGGVIVGQDVATCRVGTRVYAFSTSTGKWDSVDLGDEGDLTPSVGRVVTAAGEKGIFVFNPKVGKWTSVETEDERK